MSAFAQVATQIRKLDTLKKSLADLGMKFESGPKRVTFYGGVSREVEIYLPTLRLGFSKNPQDESYDMVGDRDYKTEVDRIRRRYTEIDAVEAFEAEGFHVAGAETLADGQVQIILKRASVG